MIIYFIRYLVYSRYCFFIIMSTSSATSDRKEVVIDVLEEKKDDEKENEVVDNDNCAVSMLLHNLLHDCRHEMQQTQIDHVQELINMFVFIEGTGTYSNNGNMRRSLLGEEHIVSTE